MISSSRVELDTDWDMSMSEVRFFSPWEMFGYHARADREAKSDPGNP